MDSIKQLFYQANWQGEELGFAKVFYKDIQKIVSMKSDYKHKIFATYLNMIGNVFYGANNVPISYTKIQL